MRQLNTKTQFARNLRKEQTEAEKVLWNRIRRRQFSNLKFKRQFPINPYIVDFVCLERHLIIELDGSQHLEKQHKFYDDRRTKFLEYKGYKVLRFFDNEILTNLHGVLEVIQTSCFPSP